jgi:hypothetical protein
MPHGHTDQVPPRDGEASPAALVILSRQELDADVERSSHIDPGEFHPAARPASRCGPMHGGLRDHRPRGTHDLEAVVLGRKSLR